MHFLSDVAFTETERLVGEAAKNQAAMNPKNTIFDAKRLIGRNFTDKNVQQDMRTWPFRVVDDGKNKPVIEAQYLGETKRFRPEEISSMVLMKMKQTAEDFLGQPVKNAVVTVPAYFNGMYIYIYIHAHFSVLSRLLVLFFFSFH
jgi:heat shock 70kDa protein 1/2/6/8